MSMARGLVRGLAKTIPPSNPAKEAPSADLAPHFEEDFRQYPPALPTKRPTPPRGKKKMKKKPMKRTKKKNKKKKGALAANIKKTKRSANGKKNQNRATKKTAERNIFTHG